MGGQGQGQCGDTWGGKYFAGHRWGADWLVTCGSIGALQSTGGVSGLGIVVLDGCLIVGYCT